MSADVLRRAAAQIREDNPPCCGVGDVCCQSVTFHLAVAAWMNACAAVIEVSPDRPRPLALAAARAYLNIGEQS